MTSKTTVLAVVIGLVLITLALISGAFVLLALDHPVPGEIWTLGGGALGGLTGVLASTRSTLGQNDVEPKVVSGVQPIGGAQDVNVTNTAADPVPVESAGH